MTNAQRQALTRLLDEVEKTVRTLPSEVMEHRVREAAMNVRTAFKLFETRPAVEEVQLMLFPTIDKDQGDGQEAS